LNPFVSIDEFSFSSWHIESGRGKSMVDLTIMIGEVLELDDEIGVLEATTNSEVAEKIVERSMLI
jgi:hypothetical protein